MNDLPFVDRVRNPQNYPKPTKFDKQGRPQTHLLSADQDEKTGNWIVYPKITVKNGKYVEQNMQDAINSGDSINFGKDQDLAIEFSKTYKDKLNPDFEKYYEEFRIKKQNGEEVNYLQAALDMLTQSAPVTEAPPGTFDLGTIEPYNPLLERFQPKPIDTFLLGTVGPGDKLKKLFKARNKIKQLLKGQEQNYKRGQDLASKYDPKDSAQGSYMMNAAIKSGKRLNEQLKKIDADIKKFYDKNK